MSERSDRKARKYPVGAEVLCGGVDFRVWAPKRKRVELVLEAEPGPITAGELFSAEMQPEGDGFFSLFTPEAAPGSLYRYRLDGGNPFPDPASRFQPAGPHGCSEVVDPSVFRWSDGDWKGVGRTGQVVYEMHVGTFTPAGSWEAAARELHVLADLGITVVEVMPVAEFPGRFGWGYDGVDLFAPTRLYGRPDDFRAFVDAAHALGLGVILDVVYNHLGPEGNYLKQYSEDYFTNRYLNEWGEALNFDGPNAAQVREFFCTNAEYWIGEFHLDGLRFDATQQIFDTSPVHVLGEITRRARRAAGGRRLFLVGENEPQRVRGVLPVEEGGFGLDALWNDDFHHSARVSLTGYNEAYYSEYLGKPQELISAIKRGYLYQGQRYFWQSQRRGSPTTRLGYDNFVHFVQNHDQVANSARGDRLHLLTTPGRYKAATALLLLAPQTPMIFQGQEFAASSPFLYFADLSPDIARLVRRGRVEFLMQFSNLASPEIVDLLDNPSEETTFTRSKLDFSERETHAPIYSLYRDLLAVRREDPVFSGRELRFLDGAVLGEEAFVIRYFGETGDRLLIVNLGRDLRLRPVPEPLLAPPEGEEWEVQWSSDHPRYDGYGTPELETDTFWRIPGHAAVVLRPARGGNT